MSSRISDPRQKDQVQDITADWDNVQIIKSGRDSAHQFDSGVFHMEQLVCCPVLTSSLHYCISKKYSLKWKEIWKGGRKCPAPYFSKLTLMQRINPLCKEYFPIIIR